MMVTVLALYMVTLSQNQRDLVMKSFRNKQIQMLVATDVAARGIDVDDITHVINYQLPDEIETYTPTALDEPVELGKQASPW